MAHGRPRRKRFVRDRGSKGVRRRGKSGFISGCRSSPPPRPQGTTRPQKNPPRVHRSSPSTAPCAETRTWCSAILGGGGALKTSPPDKNLKTLGFFSLILLSPHNFSNPSLLTQKHSRGIVPTDTQPSHSVKTLLSSPPPNCPNKKNTFNPGHRGKARKNLRGGVITPEQ